MAFTRNLSSDGWRRADALGWETAEVYLCAEDDREAAIVPRPFSGIGEP